MQKGRSRIIERLLYHIGGSVVSRSAVLVAFPRKVLENIPFAIQDIQSRKDSIAASTYLYKRFLKLDAISVAS